jgi:hypothetical protein
MEAFPSVGDLAEFTRFELSLNLQEISNGNLRDGARELLRWAGERRRERELLRKLGEARPDCAVLKATIAACTDNMDQVSPPPWYTAPEPVEACIVRGKYAVFNRDELRDGIMQLISSDGANTLVVRGASGSGCTHSLRLIRYVEDALRTFKVLHIDLRICREYGPEDVVRNFAFQLNGGTMMGSLPRSHGQESTWANDLHAWFVNQVKEREQPTWVVIDGIDHAQPRTETLDLIWALAFEAEEGSMLRVVLLGCSEPLPTAIEAVALREDIKPMKDDELQDFFERFFQHQDSSVDSAGVAAAAAARVISVVGAESQERLSRLSQMAVHVARDFATSQEVE